MRFVLVSLCCFLGGCYSYSPGASNRSAATPLAMAPGAWALDDVEPLRKLAGATPERVMAYRLDEGATREELDEAARGALDLPKVIVTSTRLVGSCLVREIGVSEDPDGMRDFVKMFTGFSPNAYSLTTSRFASPRARAHRALSAERRRVFSSFVPFRRLAQDHTALDIGLEEGVPLKLPVSIPENPRGVVIHLWALMWNEYEARVVEEFERRGWVVIEIKPPTSIDAPLSESDVARLSLLESQVREARERLEVWDGTEEYAVFHARRQASREFHEWGEGMTDVQRILERAFQVCAESDARIVGCEIAKSVDQVLAASSVAAEAALALVHERFPALAGKPVVLAGFSGGALATPTVAARLGTKAHAVIIVGGAADLFRGATQSIVTSGGVRVDCAGDPVAEPLMEIIDEAYLGASKLDPYHTAPLLTRIPVLQIHGSMDDWVPSACGDLLYERLGRPEKLEILGGHEFLFYFLPGYAPWIADWMERAVAGVGG